MIKSASIRLPNWSLPHGVTAFYTTRKGGVSSGDFGTFNLGAHVGDEKTAVIENRSRLPHADNIHWLEQTHSNVAIELPAKCHLADASFTHQHGQACAVMTADCVPILLTDRHASTIAAVHAGLQGLRTRIIEHSVNAAFANSMAGDILAWIGPHIRACHYEVSAQDSREFRHIPNAIKTAQMADKVMLNLEVIARKQLEELGIHSISSSADCTYCDEENYFSYRRARHHGQSNCGRMVSAIMLLDKS
ncbi:peptidoglycan editing factor PgeF [Alteromonas flava]|uniref:peptidoglycan editing factor PgeF n=1 Tax=Alteromonas flava TaxID=2048003 RepID=UPI000C285EDD|nr:peptidoglycan editing factor PgeF [Alteromonas flava]